MMKASVLLTKPPLSTAHLTEALRVSFMLAALGHEVDFIMIDDGVFILLEQGDGRFGKETLRMAENTENIHFHVHGGSFRRLLQNARLPENYSIIGSEELSEKLISSKVLVF